jgi:hypothetical protein
MMNIQLPHIDLSGAGRARAVWIVPDNAEHRSVWRRWLKGLAIIVLASVSLVGTATLSNLNGPRERLVALERPGASVLPTDHITANVTRQHGQDSR